MKAISWERILILIVATALCAPAILGAMEPGTEVESLLGNLIVGEPITYQKLTLFPLKAPGLIDTAKWLTLDEAMARGALTITEKEGGRVPEVTVTNKGTVPVYIFAGEIITGARQDRVVKRDTLLAPDGGQMTVGVYCVERGRWQGKGLGFSSGGSNAPSAVRKAAQCDASQSEIWDEVEKTNRSLRVAPSTGTLQAAYESEGNKKHFAAYEGELVRFPEMDREAVGVIVCAGGRIICGDIFGSRELFSAEWKKLLRSYIADALAAAASEAMMGRSEVEAFLSGLRNPRSVSREKGVSWGENLRLSWEGGEGMGLAHAGKLVHLSLFAGGESRPVPLGRVLGTDGRQHLIRE